MLTAALTIALGVLLPLVALATILLTPFADRPTQVLLASYYFSYTGAVVVVA